MNEKEILNFTKYLFLLVTRSQTRLAARSEIDPEFYDRAVNVQVGIEMCIEAQRMVLKKPRPMPKRRVSVDAVIRPVQFRLPPRRRLTDIFVTERRPDLDTFLAEPDLDEVGAEQMPDVDTILAEMSKNFVVLHSFDVP